MANLATPTGYNEASIESLFSGAGAVYFDLGLDGGETAEEVSAKIETADKNGLLLGATRGGLSFDFSYETRSVDIDGKKFEFVGSTQLISMNASVSTTLLAFDKETLMTVFGNGEWDDAKNMMKFRLRLASDSYIPVMWFLFQKSNGRGYLGIKMKNVLNTSGATIDTSNDDEATLPVTLVAHQGGVTDTQYGPVEIYKFDPADESGDAQGAAPAPASVGVSSTAAKTTAKKSS